ncbi:Uncharacterised protein [Salmonella enterica subsp. enterica serovar Typhimurium str. DT104]|nr:Uncharacterised protein [Salmonella enterica subsp. enterica serovar Typhimurium str. DT104]
MADKLSAGGHFRAHRTGVELHFTKQLRRNLRQRALGGLAPVEIHRVGIGQNEQRVGVNLAGKQGGGQIFVDHRLDTVVAIGFFHDRHAAAAVTDNQVIAANQRADGIVFHNAFRLRGGHNAAEGVTVGFEYPALFCL